MNDKVERLKGKLIVSCQALPHEPLHSSFIMGRMARAAKEGGAFGIRANTKEDIREIQTQVDLPIIGIVKRDYEDSKVYITPTMKEIEELMEVKPEIIALDATISARPNGVTLDEFFHQIKEKYPDQLLMADCSTVEEALHADELGFDFIGTTMVGYTDQSKGDKIEENDFEILRKIVAGAKHRVIAEGNINTPAKVKRVIELGAFSVVVGSIITRPQLITKSFAEALDELDL
jgi:N-acylglucosamine-6-phosphate 2-epimerase